MIELHIYGILAILEILLVVSGLALYLYAHNRRQKRAITRLNASLRQRPEPAPARDAAPATPAAPTAAVAETDQSYSDFLREELDASSLMLGSAGNDSGDADGEAEEQDQVRQMLAARHQFLQLELDAQGMGKDPESRRRHLVEQMQNLLATFTPDAAEPVEEEEEAGDGEEQATLGREQQLESQLEHLRSVVSNQQDVMRELRELLEREMGESEEMRDIIARLQDAEASSLELERSLEVMSKPLAGGGAGAGKRGHESSPDSDMLRDLVGSQQQTINNLQNMLRESVGEKEASMELRDAMEKIQRSNQELGTCVMVLEDENSLLRDQVQSLQSQLEEFMGGEETTAADDATPSMAEASAAGVEADAAARPDEVEHAAEVPGPENPSAADAEPETGPTPTESAEATEHTGQVEVDAAGEETVEDIDALLESAASASEETPTEGQAQQEPEPLEDVDALLETAGAAPAQDAATEDRPADAEDEAQADDGINTLKDVGLDSDDDAEPLSNEDIDALLSDENKN